MAGGDLHIQVRAGNGYAGIQKVIDASSTKNADLGLTEPMTVGGRNVFVTPDAKARIENDYMQPGAQGTTKLTVESDTRQEGTFFGLFKGKTVNNLPMQPADGSGRPQQRWPEEYLGTPAGNK